MPLFLKNKICLIHIPKCGGTSVTSTFELHLDDPPVFIDRNFKPDKNFLNHSPQHSSYSELKRLNLLPQDFKIISFVRHPYERFLSEYCWRIEIAQLNENVSQDEFAENFFFGLKFWDQHNYTQKHYLDSGFEHIKIYTIDQIQKYFVENFSVQPLKRNATKSKELRISQIAKNIVDKQWACDFEIFEKYKKVE